MTSDYAIARTSSAATLSSVQASMSNDLERLVDALAALNLAESLFRKGELSRISHILHMLMTPI
jgi:hypothetical protein